jgi:23S rRNA (uracil1939-C5)-methyltransferase
MQEVSDALEVESLDLEGQGVARRPDGKVVFVEGALPGERVRVQVLRRKNNWEQGTLETLLRESSQRVRPPCPHFGLHAGACGGCKVQHLHPAAQVAVKQRVLEDDLWHLAKVRPARVLRPIEGPAWGYRWRARLSVRHVAKKGTVLVGFHERKSRYVADMKTCPVLPPAVSGLLVPLRELVGSLDQRDRIPQIELAVGDAVLALVLRHLEPLSAADQARLRAFATEHAGIGLQWWLQPKGPETVHLLDEGGAQLGYALPEFDVFMPYRPTDFTQVNPGINRAAAGAPGKHRAGGGRLGHPGGPGSRERAAQRPGGADDLRGARPVQALSGRPGGGWVGTALAGRSAARGRVCTREGAGRAAPRRPAQRQCPGGGGRRLAAPAAHRVRELQPGHAGA